jgi:hypothetical protein
MLRGAGTEQRAPVDVTVKVPEELVGEVYGALAQDPAIRAAIDSRGHLQARKAHSESGAESGASPSPQFTITTIRVILGLFALKTGDKCAYRY